MPTLTGALKEVEQWKELHLRAMQECHANWGILNKEKIKVEKLEAEIIRLKGVIADSIAPLQEELTK